MALAIKRKVGTCYIWADLSVKHLLTLAMSWTTRDVVGVVQHVGWTVGGLEVTGSHQAVLRAQLLTDRFRRTAWHTCWGVPAPEPREFVTCLRCFSAFSLDLYIFCRILRLDTYLVENVMLLRCAFHCGLLTLSQSTKSLLIFSTEIVFVFLYLHILQC